MKPPNVQSPFARCRYSSFTGETYLDLLRGRYSSVIAPTDSCANPMCLSPTSALASFVESSQVATSPCCHRDLPDDISASPSEDAWALTTTVCRLHLPVSSPATLAFPRKGSRSAYREYPLKRLLSGANFRGCSHFFMLPGRAVARTGLRMMPTFPPLPLKSRTAGFPQYGFKADISDGAFPFDYEFVASHGLPPSFVYLATCNAAPSL
jgi:hypothetical protein